MALLPSQKMEMCFLVLISLATVLLITFHPCQGSWHCAVIVYSASPLQFPLLELSLIMILSFLELQHREFKFWVPGPYLLCLGVLRSFLSGRCSDQSSRGML